MNVVYCFTNNGEKMCLNDATIGLKGDVTVIPFPTLNTSLQHEGFFTLQRGDVNFRYYSSSNCL
jgi:hypothetical protein